MTLSAAALVLASVLAGVPSPAFVPRLDRVAVYPLHARGVFAITLNPRDPDVAITTGFDEAVRRVDLCTGRVAWTFRRPPPDTSTALLAVSPGWRWVATGDPMDRAFLIDAATGQARTLALPRPDSWRLPPVAGAFSADDRYLFLLHANRVLKYEAATGELVATYTGGLVGGIDGIGLGMRADGRLWALSQQRGLTTWPAGEPAAPVVRRMNPQPTPTAVTRIFGDRYVSAVFSWGSEEAGLVDAETGVLAQQFAVTTGSAAGLDLSGDLSLTVIASYDQTLRIVATRTAEELDALAVVSGAGDPTYASSVAVAPSGKVVVAGLHTGEVAVYADRTARRCE